MLTLNMGIANRSQDIKGPMCKQKSPHGLLSKAHTVKQTVTKHSSEKDVKVHTDSTYTGFLAISLRLRV